MTSPTPNGDTPLALQDLDPVLQAQADKLMRKPPKQGPLSLVCPKCASPAGIPCAVLGGQRKGGWKSLTNSCRERWSLAQKDQL